MKAQTNGQWLRVTYHAFTDDGTQYSDTLHSTEIAISREWLDKVVRVDVLSEPPETIDGKTATELLDSLTTANMLRQNRGGRS